jgi:hypothetical protein
LLVIAACRSSAPDYPAAGVCPALPDKPADWCNGKVTTLGAVHVETMKGQTPAPDWVAFQDLENIDETDKTPLLYQTMCYRCFIREGEAYRARLTKEGNLYSVLVDGRELVAGAPYNETDPILSGYHFDSAGRSSIAMKGTCTEKAPAHWEKRSFPKIGDADFWPQCIAGKDTRPWPLASPTEQATLPRCNEHDGFANETVTVVIDVYPGSGMSWLFDEAPAEVAHVLLYQLNQNTSGIQFTEASGVEPMITLSVTVTQTIEGTERDTAEAQVNGLGEGYLFSMTSGDSAYTSWEDAVAALSRNLLGYFVDGWHNARPCVKRDRSILR